MKNLTGRVFMCISHEENNEGEWNDMFNIGGIYNEAIKDIDGVNLSEGDEDCMLIYSNHGLALYVKSDCFALMPESTEELRKLLKIK